MNIHHNKNIMNALITEIESNPKLAKYFNRYFLISSLYAGILKCIFYFIVSVFIYFLLLTRAEQEGLYTYLFFLLVSIFPFVFAGIEYVYNHRFYAYQIKTEKRLSCEFEHVLSQNKINFTRMQSKMEFYEFVSISTILLNKTTDTLDLIESVRKFKNINFRMKKKKELLNKESQIILKKTAANSNQPAIPAFHNSQEKTVRLHSPFLSNEALSGYYGDLFKRWQAAVLPISLVSAFSFCMWTAQNIENKADEYFIATLNQSADKQSAIVALNKYNTIYKSRIHVTHKNNQIQINALNNFVWGPVISALADSKISITNMTLNNRPIDMSKNSELNKILLSSKDKWGKKGKLRDYFNGFSIREDNVLIINYH